MLEEQLLLLPQGLQEAIMGLHDRAGEATSPIISRLSLHILGGFRQLLFSARCKSKIVNFALHFVLCMSSMPQRHPSRWLAYFLPMPLRRRVMILFFATWWGASIAVASRMQCTNGVTEKPQLRYVLFGTLLRARRFAFSTEALGTF